jgi:hypothetical protein
MGKGQAREVGKSVMTEASLDIFTLATAADACLTVAEALDDKDPNQPKYLAAGKKLAAMVEGFVAEHAGKVKAEANELG